jgi:hypothetical protein
MDPVLPGPFLTSIAARASVEPSREVERHRGNLGLPGRQRSIIPEEHEA